MRSNKKAPPDGLSLVGLFLLAVMLLNAISSPDRHVEAAAAQGNPPALEVHTPDWDAVVAPYDEYVITQGVHGESYGHAAIDLTAGNGAEIKSPINGEVEALYIDEYGNTTLILENERWQVTLLHGLYKVEPGQAVALGEVVGTESNQGFTVDYLGRLCSGRDCGYHTHLNIYDKQQQANINPLELINP